MSIASWLNRLKKTPKLPKYLAVVKSDALILSKEENLNEVFEKIYYKTIKGLNCLDKSSVSFKTNKSGYVLIFDRSRSDVASFWFENLLILTSKDLEVKEKINSIDLTSKLEPLNFKSVNIDLRLNPNVFIKEENSNRRLSKDQQQMKSNKNVTEEKTDEPIKDGEVY